MTPSSTSEPELGNAKTTPPGTDPNSSDAPKDAVVAADSPAVESSDVTSSDPNSSTTPEVAGDAVAETTPIAADKPTVAEQPVAEQPVAATQPVTSEASAAETTPLAKSETTALPSTGTTPVANETVENRTATGDTGPSPAGKSQSVTSETLANGTTTGEAAANRPDPSGPVDPADDITPMTDAEAREYEARHGHDSGRDGEDNDYEVLATGPSNRYPTVVPMIGAILGLTAIAALMLVAFALPAVKSAPHDLPIGVAGTAEITKQLEGLFSANGSTTFDVTTFTKETDLRSAIEDHELYGGLSVSESGVTMMVSSGASPSAAEALNSVANSLSSQAGQQIPVTDVVPIPKADARGQGLAASNLPLVIIAILPALILIPLYPRRKGAQLAIAAAASVLIGLGLSAVFSLLIGSTEDSNFLLVSIGLAAGVLATSVLLIGLFAVAGRIGFGVGAALLVLFAAPLSGLANAPEWLPKPWGDVGQLLPPGANASLLRVMAYFDGQGFARPTLVLLAWALVGLLLLGASLLLKKETPADSEPVQESTREPVEV